VTRARRAAGAAVLALPVLCCSAGVPSSDPPAPRTPLAGAIRNLVDAERSRAGLTRLREDARLTRAAQIHADRMAQTGRLEHELPGAHPRLEDRVDAAGYGWQAIGENLAVGQGGAQVVVADWMRSPAHRANILNPTFLDTGVGHANDSTGRPYFAQVFARPR
jgi:uncharacterized protein YkwD